MSLFLTFLGLCSAVAAVFNSNEARKNAETANDLNEDTKKTIDPALNKLNNCCYRLSETLRKTCALKKRALDVYTDSFVYYLKHIHNNVDKEESFSSEIAQLQSAMRNYQKTMDGLISEKLDENTMLLSTVAGGLVTGAGALGLEALGKSMSLGLGLSLFGVGSFLMSVVQASKTKDALEKAQYINANKMLLKKELEDKNKAVLTVNAVFINYNDMLSNLMCQFAGEIKTVQKIYKKQIVGSRDNIKRISMNEEPIILFEDLSEEEQKDLYLALEKCKVMTNFARANVLTKKGDVNYREVRMLGILNE